MLSPQNARYGSNTIFISVIQAGLNDSHLLQTENLDEKQQEIQDAEGNYKRQQTDVAKLQGNVDKAEKALKEFDASSADNPAPDHTAEIKRLVMESKDASQNVSSWISHKSATLPQAKTCPYLEQEKTCSTASIHTGKGDHHDWQLSETWLDGSVREGHIQSLLSLDL